MNRLKLLFIGFCLLSSVVLAQAPGANTRSVTVTAIGTAYGVPNKAAFDAGVSVLNADVRVALDRVSERVSSLTQALKAAGVAECDVRTSNFSVYSEPTYNNQGQPIKMRYRAINTVSVTVRDTAQLGKLLSESVGSGANEIYNVIYTFADQTALERQAREDAVTNAREKAEQLASLGGVELGVVKRIVEGGVPGGVTPFGADAFAEGSMMSGGVPAAVSGGQLAVTVSVQVTFGLK